MQWDVKGDTTLGPFEPQPTPLAEVERLADACTRAGMPTKAVADARGPQWRKVIFNAATNPVGALTGLTHGRVCEDPPLRALVTGLVDEGKAVAAAQGIELDADPEALIDHAARPDVAYDHRASMLQDVEARRHDRDRLPQRRHRPLRRRARRADAAQRGDRGARERGGALVVDAEAERRYAAGPRGAGARRASTRSSPRAASTRASRAPSATSRASTSSTATRTCCCRCEASRRSSSRPRPATSASTATRWIDDQVFADRPGEWLGDAAARGSASACTGSTTS